MRRIENQQSWRWGVGVLALAALYVGCASGGQSEPSVADAMASRDHDFGSIATAYEQHCALCHGENGDGQGAAARFLSPAPRDFTLGQFALASTRNGVPTIADLTRTIRRGMPGSSMPSFEWMDDDALERMAEYVRYLAVEGLARNLRTASEAEGLRLQLPGARALAETRLTPGEPIARVGAAPQDAETLELGRETYLEHCAACHGLDGKGRKPTPDWTDTHEIWTVRDFTAGIMKGPSTRQELHRRVVAGMPASVMPPTRVEDPKAAAALITYVESLIPAGANERLRQRHTEIRATRIEGQVPEHAGDAAWDKADEVELALAPLAWNDAAIAAAKVAALHDGETFAVRVRWQDTSRNDRLIGGSGAGGGSDAAAVQFSAAERPAVFGMGSDENPVNIWHWKAYRFRDVAGLTDLRPPHSHMADVPLQRHAPGVREPSTGADSVRVHGFQTLPYDRDKHRVTANPSYADGEWTIVFRRALRTEVNGEIDLEPGGKVQLGVAIWNGAARRRGERKATTIWHSLTLAR